MGCSSLISSLLSVADSRSSESGCKTYLHFDQEKGVFSSRSLSKIERVKKFFNASAFSSSFVARAIVEHSKIEANHSVDDLLKAQFVVNRIFSAAGDKPIDLFKGMNADWMSRIDIREQPLHRLVLPATHDSCAYQVDFSSLIPTENIFLKVVGFVCNLVRKIRTYVAGWTVTQHYSIREQLELGVRSFDFRISQKDGIFYATHTFNCVPLQVVLEDIREFMHAHKEEVIIIRSKPDFEHRGGMKGDVSQKYVDFVQKEIGPFLAPPRKVLDDSMVLKTLVEKGERIIFHYADADQTDCLFSWDAALFNDQWDNLSDIKKKKDCLEETLERYKEKSETLNAVQFTLTPQVKDVALGVFRSQDSLKKMTPQIRDVIPDYLGRLRNVSEVFTDFITPDIAFQIIRQNSK
jgi:hypothetical protein